jgi:hypothetical protein
MFASDSGPAARVGPSDVVLQGQVRTVIGIIWQHRYGMAWSAKQVEPGRVGERLLG